MRWLVALVVVVAAAAAWWWWHRTPASAPAKPAHVAAPPTKVVHIGSADERRKIAEAIATAVTSRKNAASSSTTPAPSLPAVAATSPKDLVRALGDVLGQVHDQLDDCVKRVPGITGFNAKLALTGDPDVGTLIDQRGMTGSDGGPLPKPFEDCVNDVLFDLELPPLAVGEHYNVDFDFEW